MHSNSIERKQLVSFGVIMAIAALFFGWLYSLMILTIVGAAFAIAAVARPGVLLPLYRPWMRLAEALGWLNTRILLILIYYLLVTPIGLVLRLFRRSPLDHPFWSEVPKHSYGDKHYEKQF